MLLATDACYAPTRVTVACVGFGDWPDATSALELVLTFDAVAAAYVPGAFYQRELPFLLGAIERVRGKRTLTGVIVDGHVWLGPGRPGLGAHLHRALGGGTPAIGVAKTAFVGAPAIPIVRGSSARPLFVTAEGIAPQDAAAAVRAMHGRFRIPTMIKRADQLAREPHPNRSPRPHF